MALHRPHPPTPSARCTRSPAATRALALLVFGDDQGGPPRCPTPCDLVAHMRRASGRAAREEAARLVRVLLREAGADPFIPRLLVQVLVPGLVSVAGKLRWGQGGDWQDGEEFFGELLSTTWCVVAEWAGQDRRYAVLDLLSAIRCRLRRQLFRSKDLAGRTVARRRSPERIAPPRRCSTSWPGPWSTEHDEGMPADELQVLYGHSVLGYSIAELAAHDRSRSPRPLHPPGPGAASPLRVMTPVRPA